MTTKQTEMSTKPESLGERAELIRWHTAMADEPNRNEAKRQKHRATAALLAADGMAGGEVDWKAECQRVQALFEKETLRASELHEQVLQVKAHRDHCLRVMEKLGDGGSPTGWVDDGGMVFWKDKPPADGTDIYTRPQQAAQVVQPLTHIGYFNKRYGTIFRLGELASSERNTELLASGEIVQVFLQGIGKDKAP